MVNYVEYINMVSMAPRSDTIVLLPRGGNDLGNGMYANSTVLPGTAYNIRVTDMNASRTRPSPPSSYR